MNESTKFQNGSLTRVKNKTTSDSWLFRFREDINGRRVQRNIKIGSVLDLPHRRDAEKALLNLRAKINSGVRTLPTVLDLTAHYRKNELTSERKAFTTIAGHTVYINRYIAAKWGSCKLSEVRTIAVEQWLDSLPLAPATKAKIRNIMSAIFAHAIRYEWIHHNPISAVRTSAIRLREPDVLTPEEFGKLLPHLSLRERAMVMLAGATGLRRSEMFALRWSDVDLLNMQVAITRSIVRNRIGNVKTPASRKPVPMHPIICNVLEEWRKQTLFSRDADFIFASIRLNGTKPLTPDMVLKKIVRPALEAAGITGKVIGWHSFRHSLATNLRSLGVDVKVAQELLRHANSRITMDVYTRAVSEEKRIASRKQIDMMMGVAGGMFRSVPSALDVTSGITINSLLS
jgi:integrase